VSLLFDNVRMNFLGGVRKAEGRAAEDGRYTSPLTYGIALSLGSWLNLRVLQQHNTQSVRVLRA